MSVLIEWKLLRICESSEQMISGPGIDLLKRTVEDMAGRGVPNEYNDYGFNKGDWNTYQGLSHYLSQSSLPARVATTFVRMLAKYRNTQVTNYDEISRMVTADFRNANATNDSEAGGEMDSDKIHIYGDQPLTYGKVKVYIPSGLDMGDIRAINQIVDQKFRDEGTRQEEDRYGNYGFPRFKKFQKDANNPNIFHIHTGILEPVIETIRSRKRLEVTGHAPNVSTPVQRATDGSQEGGTSSQPEVNQEIEILGKLRTPYGEKLKVKFNVPWEKQPWVAIKSAGLSPIGAIYSIDDHNQNRKGIILINIDSKEMFDKVRDVIAEKGVNTGNLDHFGAEHFRSEPHTSSEERPTSPPTEAEGRESHRIIKVIDFTNLGENEMKVKVNYMHPELHGNIGKKGFIRELIQYTFPEYTWNKANYFYSVKGNYSQYINFEQLLKKFNYDTTELRQIIDQKLNSGQLKKLVYHGQYDSDENYDQIVRDIDEQLPDNTYELYDQQKQGVAFLYGRHSAILGDETGVGKTVQMITAAALRMKKEPHPTLIVTLKATQKQWVETIKSVCGTDEEQNISLDGTTPKKWTVLYYDNFNKGTKLPQIMEACKNANFGIIIFDEVHKLKHEKSKQSRNLAEIIKNTPTVWGASATVSSNKPLDVKNQLAMLKHHLGSISNMKFKMDFAGNVGGIEADEGSDAQMQAAERLNRWLNLSGVYVRRTKTDIRDMPTLNRQQPTPGKINQSEFDTKVAEKLLRYKDPSLAISKLIAAREVIAQLKVDMTVNKVVRIVRDNMENSVNNYAASKVVVFTNFVESANQLVSKLTASMRGINPDFKVITYLSMTRKSQRQRVKEEFTNNPNAKVLVMSLKMGGTGIDFPNAAQNMVINDFDWTPESAEQSEGRIYRINTTHPVNINYTLAKGIDEKIYSKVQRKREIASIIQKYRKELHQKEHDPDLMQKIIDAQRETQEIDREMADIISQDIPDAPDRSNESFKGYMSSYEAILNHWNSINS